MSEANTREGSIESRPAIRLRDYTPPAFFIDQVALRFELDETECQVHSILSVRRNTGSPHCADLSLHGNGQPLLGAKLDGETLAPERCTSSAEMLTITAVPDQFELELITQINPRDNASLEGLYLSSGNFCTQCEAEGFRKITWFADRPDVMSRFTTTLVADKARYPILLSNGNLIDHQDLGDGKHLATYEDPFPKPSYLFALVAGDLAAVSDTFTTASGRDVRLKIFVEHHNRDRCEHAMRSLKKSMRWDEQVYGLEYDLDDFAIVAVDDFNMGAMENKGLNIFNSKYVLASAETATDDDFANIEGIIAHEYFHNWTGNRVTCRDWFQLSLKEGLTVFRDQQFSADVGSSAVKRIQEARILRTHQFAEDAGPMAHPVRPESYIEISNFYTVTIYNKGAEVIRMMHTLLGPERFRAGMDLYFERHDGQAVTIEDFVAAMENANQFDLAQFRLWYSQAGTPEVEYELHYDSEAHTATLELAQYCPPTPGQGNPGQDKKQPFHIPLKIALLDMGGHRLDLELDDEQPGTPAQTARLEGELLHFTDQYQQVRFKNVQGPVFASVGREFSAPVRIKSARGDDELAFLMSTDDDPFNRWDAAQSYALEVLNDLTEASRDARPLQLPQLFVDAFGRSLTAPTIDRALIAETLRLPSESYLADQHPVIDVDAVHRAREFARFELAKALEPQFRDVLKANSSNSRYSFAPEDCARRALGNLCLSYLAMLQQEDILQACLHQAANADNMTDALAALAALTQTDSAQRELALQAFEQRWRNEPLVMDKWFSLQAVSSQPDALDLVRGLLEHRSFDRNNPNRIRSLLGAFAHGNQVRFNAADGSGYAFIADSVIDIDARNPQVAARLLGAFGRYKRFDMGRREKIEIALQRVLASETLSKDCYEVASKILPKAP